jgi:hypothetical protein
MICVDNKHSRSIGTNSYFAQKVVILSASDPSEGIGRRSLPETHFGRLRCSQVSEPMRRIRKLIAFQPMLETSVVITIDCRKGSFLK